MSDQLDFSLPGEGSRRGTPPRSGGYNVVLLLIILVAVIGIGVLSLRRANSPGPPDQGMSPDREREIAAKLQDRGLKVSAAEVWLKYAAATKLEPQERATIYYQVGKLYRSEASATVDDLRLDLARRKVDCFRRLGNFAGLNQEMVAMTSLTPGEAEATGGEAVAELGPRKITMADVDREIDRMVDLQLRQYSAYMTEEQLNQQKEKFVGQFRSKQAKLQILQEMVAKEVLLREAIKRGLDKKRENDEAIEEYRKSLLANKVLDEEITQRVNITESDLKDYYEAHKEDYREKAGVEISWIVVEEKEAAAAVLQALENGKSFEECAKEFSIDDITKEQGGEVPGKIEKGGDIPGIGNNVDVHAHLFSLKENEISSEPVVVDDKYYVFKVRKVVPERVQPYDEVSYDVSRKKREEKVREVREALIQRLQNEHGAIIHRSKFMPEETDENKNPEEEKKATPVSAPGTT
jgi:parvulin-like peptidyl-prolyl isomerase